MSRAEKKARALARRVKSQQKLMDKGEGIVAAALEYAEKADRRSEVWRNLFCASAFARGLGNERPISEVIEECFPALLGIMPFGVSNAPLRAGEPGVLTVAP